MTEAFADAYDALTRAEVELDAIEAVLSRSAVAPLRAELTAARRAVLVARAATAPERLNPTRAAS